MRGGRIGEGGSEIGEKGGESGGAAGGRMGGRRRGGVVGAGMLSKTGIDRRWAATSRGFSQRSVVVSVVRRAGQSNRCETL